MAALGDKLPLNNAGLYESGMAALGHLADYQHCIGDNCSAGRIE